MKTLRDIILIAMTAACLILLACEGEMLCIYKKQLNDLTQQVNKLQHEFEMSVE